MLDRPATALHEQVRSVLTHEIESGLYDDKGRLPTETELCERFSVSRITVRRAVGELESDGLVQRKQGQGTFIRLRRAVTTELALGGFADNIVAGDGVSDRVILLAEKEKASAEVSSALGIGYGAPVFHLIRLLRLDGLPLTRDECYYSLDRFPNFDQLVNDKTSTYQVLRTNYGVEIARVKREICVTYASAASSEALHRPENDPLLLINKVVTDVDGRIVHISRLECVPARVTMSIVSTSEIQPAAVGN